MKYLKLVLALWWLACSSSATSMYFDQESGLNYNGHRSYRPPDGRYTQPDPMGLEGGWSPFEYAHGDPLMFADPTGLIPVYKHEGVTFNVFPGPQAGGNEHARFGPGESYHLHLRDRNGNEARISSETWKPLTPDDARKLTPGMRAACDSLSDAEKKFLDRVNREVFHRGAPTVNQLLRIGNMRGTIRGGGRGNE